MTKKSTIKLLSLGDVLRTHPIDGYWGCAIVLTVSEKTEQFAPMCHIGITTAVFRHVHSWRAENDREAWLKDIAAAQKSHEEMLVRLKEKMDPRQGHDA